MSTPAKQIAYNLCGLCFSGLISLLTPLALLILIVGITNFWEYPPFGPIFRMVYGGTVLISAAGLGWTIKKYRWESLYFFVWAGILVGSVLTFFAITRSGYN